MRNVIIPKLLLAALTLTTVLQSCKDDAFLQIPAETPKQNFKEGCDSASAMTTRGWSFVNNSFPKGGGVWQNGGDATAPFFNPFSSNGSYAGFIGVGVNSTITPVAADAAPDALLSPTAPQGFVSNYMISPKLIMKNGDKIVFYTRSQILDAGGGDSTDWGNRLQVRINSHGTDNYVGSVKGYWSWLYTSTSTQVDDNSGNFDIVLLDINPAVHEWHKVAPGASVIDGRPYNNNTNLQAYPTRWTRFEATVSGLNGPTEGKFAFRYYVPGGDPNNGYATGVGIDNIEYISK